MGDNASFKYDNEPSFEQYQKIALIHLKMPFQNTKEWNEYERFNDVNIPICFHSNGNRNLYLLKKALCTFQLYKENYFGNSNVKKINNLNNNTNSNSKSFLNTLIDFHVEEEEEATGLYYNCYPNYLYKY
jgi:hypothetical protein